LTKIPPGKTKSIRGKGEAHFTHIEKGNSNLSAWEDVGKSRMGGEERKKGPGFVERPIIRRRETQESERMEPSMSTGG